MPKKFAAFFCFRLVHCGQRSNSDVFLAPVDDRGTPVADEGQWLKSGRIAHNTPGTLDFFLPKDAKAGTKYCIVIRTSYSNNKTMLKKHKDIVSSVVTVKAAS